jgi:hypothetical protein
VFNPAPTGGRNWRPKKQNPVPREGTPRTPGRDIEKTGQESSLCTPGRDIEPTPHRTPGRDITSLTSCSGGEAEAEPEPAAPDPEWTTPVPTEVTDPAEAAAIRATCAPPEVIVDIWSLIRRDGQQATVH